MSSVANVTQLALSPHNATLAVGTLEAFQATATNQSGQPVAGVRVDFSVSGPIDGKRVRRSYTIASSPTETAYAEVTVRRQEHHGVSLYLHDRVSVGSLLDISAASGRFAISKETSNRHARNIPRRARSTTTSTEERSFVARPCRADQRILLGSNEAHCRVTPGFGVIP